MNVWSMAEDGRDKRIVTKHTGWDVRDPALDNGRIVYQLGADLWTLDIATGQKTQLTFGTHDDSTAQFLDDDTLVYSSTATDPSQPIDPEVARNGNIYNIWTLSLKTGELKQYTDAMGGNTSAVVLRDAILPVLIATLAARVAAAPAPQISVQQD